MIQVKKRVDQLRPHPDNANIYRDAADPELIASVKEKGIQQPLIVTYDDRIISGHRRHEAARINGIQEVDVLVCEERDENEIRYLIVHNNYSRKKTNEQIGREAIIVWEVEQERARKRQEEASRHGSEGGRGKKKTLPETVPEGFSGGDTRDIVGAQMKMSGRTLGRIVDAVKTIDELEEGGEVDKAEEVRKALDVGARTAEKTIKKLKAKPVGPVASAEQPQPEPGSHAAAFEKIRRAIKDLRSAIGEAANDPLAAELCVQLAPNGGKPGDGAVLRQLLETINGSEPAARGCCYCDGTSADCGACFGRGWVCRRIYKKLSDVQRCKLRAL